MSIKDDPSQYQALNVSLDRAQWVRMKSDGTVPGIGSGVAARKQIYLSSGVNGVCPLGAVGAAMGIAPESMQGKNFLSEVGINDLLQPVISADGQQITLEREIARLNDREGPYADVSEEYIEARIAGLLSAAGINFTFV